MEEISAYHESGHAFMAVRVGAQVRSVTIDPDWDDGPRRTGDAQIAWQPGRWSNKEYHQKRIMVALAGPVAEMIHSGDPFHPGLVEEWQGDWSEALRAAAELHTDHQRRLAHLETTTVELYQWLRQDQHWAALAALADHLLAHETLEGEQVLEILAPWTR